MELKPCPKCKDNLDIEIIVNDDRLCIDGVMDFGTVYRFECLYCGASTEWCETPEQAVKAWNRRADE